jgi:hypothetical protein
MVAKPQYFFTSAKRCYRKGNGGVHRHAVQPKNLILVRKLSRDLGQTYAGKAVPGRSQRLPFAYGGFLTMVAAKRI